MPDLAEQIRTGRLIDSLGSAGAFYDLHYVETTSSTNDDVRAAALRGASEGLVIVAGYQSAGRGRRGRRWWSKRGQGLTCSVLLRPSLAPAASHLLAFAAALSAAAAIESCAHVSARTKWPNDILVKGKKIGGVLVESRVAGSQIEAAIVGIGLNHYGRSGDWPQEVQERAITLEAAGPARLPSRGAMLATLLVELHARYLGLQSDGGDDLLAEWRQRDIVLGKQVTVTLGSETVEALAVEVGPCGELILEGSNGVRRTVTAGEVTLR